MDLDFCISFKRELDASERTLSLKNDFSWYAICDIYYDNGDSATLFFAKSFMVLNHKVYKRNEKLVKLIEKALPDSLVLPPRMMINEKN
jgi:hypothetical protein